MEKIDVQTRFGTAVRAVRNQLGISQEELAGRAGLHRTYISDIERGARNVSLESIEKLALALETTISSLFSSTNGTNGSSQFASMSDSSRVMEILLVEDDDCDIELTIEAFKSSRITNPIHLVRDGKEALDFAFGTGAYAPACPSRGPLVILLDLNLPQVTGLEVLRQLKNDARTRAIPVIVLTVSQKDRDIAECRRLGAETYIVKPVDFQGLCRVTPLLSFRWALLEPNGSQAQVPKT